MENIGRFTLATFSSQFGHEGDEILPFSNKKKPHPATDYHARPLINELISYTMVPRATNHAGAPSDDEEQPSPFFTSSSSSAFLSTLPVDDFDAPNVVFLSPVSLTTCPIINTYVDSFETIFDAITSSSSDEISMHVHREESDPLASSTRMSLTPDIIDNTPSSNFLSKVIDYDTEETQILPNSIDLSVLSLSSSPTTFGWEHISPFDAPTCAGDKDVNSSHSSSCAATFTATNKAQAKPRSRKTVSFSNVSVQEHSVIVGDHPCAMTLPIALGWDHTHPLTIRLDAYEQLRGPRRRRGTELCMPYYKKKNLLRRISGMNEVDIRKAERRVRMMQSAMDGGDEEFWRSSSGGKEGRMRKLLHRVKSLEVIQRLEDGEDEY